MEKAVAFMYDLLQKIKGETVWFSLIGPSFGFCKNFIEHDNHFIKIVNVLD